MGAIRKEVKRRQTQTELSANDGIPVCYRSSYCRRHHVVKPVMGHALLTYDQPQPSYEVQDHATLCRKGCCSAVVAVIRRQGSISRRPVKKSWKEESCFSSLIFVQALPAPLSIGEVVLGGYFPAAKRQSQLALQEGEEDVVPAEH